MHACPHPIDRAEVLFPASDYITGETFQVARCALCAQVVTLPVPADISRFYPAGYYGDKESRRFPAPVEWLQRKLYARRAQLVLGEAQGRKGRVLDVGCGRGMLLRAFQENGFEITGTEFSDEACRYAREVLKIPVCVGPLETLGFGENSFDVITMWHVLEHVSDPRSTLSEVARILRPGGLFLVGVPNFGGPEARLTRAGWFHLDVPRHLSHHTPSSLKCAMITAGLRPVRMSFFAPEYDCFSFVQSLLNWLGVRHNFLYNLLRGQRAKVFGRNESFGSLAATAILAPLLGAVSLPATLVLGACGLGSALTLVAVNQKQPKPG
jgi:SAM-dependent methyltransferase